VGFAPPPPSPLTFGPPLGHGVLFKAPVQCPPLLVWLGETRRRSSYLNRTSPVRFPIQAYLDAFPGALAAPTAWADMSAAQRAVVLALEIGDAAARVDLVSEVWVEQPGANFTHSAMGHYGACAPVSCTYTLTKPRDQKALALEVIATFGGNGAIIMSLLTLAVGWLAFFGRRHEKWGIRQAKLKARREGRPWPPPEEGEEAEGGGEDGGEEGGGGGGDGKSGGVELVAVGAPPLAADELPGTAVHA